MENREPCALLVRMQTDAATVEKQYGLSSKIKNGTAFHPAKPKLGVYCKGLETPIQMNLCTPTFITAQFIVAKC